MVASIVVNDGFATHGAEWCGIIIKGSMEVLPCKDLWFERGLAMYIEREFSLQEESFPQISR